MGIAKNRRSTRLHGSTNRNKENYKFYEKLPTSRMPEEISAYIIQHRFRKDKDRWPLIQLGPGILTLNETEDYTWDTFRDQIKQMLVAFYDSYPNSINSLKYNRIQLRYIDAVEFDYASKDILKFLKDNLKVNFLLPQNLFEEDEINSFPSNIDFRLNFKLKSLKGIVNVRFTTGKKRDKNHLIWETIVESNEKDVPQNKENIIKWADMAHEITHKWFFKLIEGNLERRFE